MLLNARQHGTHRCSCTGQLSEANPQVPPAERHTPISVHILFDGRGYTGAGRQAQAGGAVAARRAPRQQRGPGGAAAGRGGAGGGESGGGPWLLAQLRHQGAQCWTIVTIATLGQCSAAEYATNARLSAVSCCGNQCKLASRSSCMLLAAALPRAGRLICGGASWDTRVSSEMAGSSGGLMPQCTAAASRLALRCAGGSTSALRSRCLRNSCQLISSISHKSPRRRDDRACTPAMHILHTRQSNGGCF